jgi:type II secretory ATPase GspE/PulE/Tfp pilus assembly ATPase PilB-like protein
MKKQLLTLKFMDGEDIEVVLAEPFTPNDTKIDVLLQGTEIRLTYPLLDLACINFRKGEEIKALSPVKLDSMEEVITLTGIKYQVHIPPKQDCLTGFFGTPVDVGGPWEKIFFCNHGIKEHKENKLLGQILEAKGLVSSEDIQTTIEDQQKLRTRRVGEIIAKKNNIPQKTIDNALISAIERNKVPSKARIGDILVATGLITRQQVEEAISSQKSGKKKRVGELLMDRGLINEDQLLSALAEKFRLPYVNLEETVPTPAALAVMTVEMANRLQVIPLKKNHDSLLVVTSSPTDPTLQDTLRFNTNCRIELAVATSGQIAKAIAFHYNTVKDEVELLIGSLTEDVITVEEEEDDVKYSEADSQIIHLVNKLLLDGQEKRASDIHFEPGLDKAAFRIRYRIDGICRIAHQIAFSYRHAIISRLKIMARLDIAEHRRPQSGKIMIRSGNRNLEFRLEITPSVGGQEDAVLRLLTGAKALPLEGLKFSAANLENFKSCLSKPYGVILCVGPTGSGKTTTLHSALAHINTPDRKIWTAEDPVEITQPGLRQVQVYPKIGFTFQSAMRSFLRADPDVIMVGEMRDSETAKTAIEASLTGHLVFSTLHTNSAPETIVRLIEMGMDPVNFAEAVLGILAQRLARKLCSECKESYHPTRDEYDDLVYHYGKEWFELHKLPPFTDDLTLMHKIGCEKCEGTGYSGRVGIHELLVGTKSLKKAIKKLASAAELKELGLGEGMTTLKMDGIEKIFMGITDLEQILRVCL